MSEEIADIRVDSIVESELARLIAVGEPGGVELKAAIPNAGLAPSVAAFANSGGGWLLLGVADDGEVVGFEVPGRGHAHDWLRDHLQLAIDPVPEFRTALVRTSSGAVTVVRIPASVSTPHVLRRTGVVYERVSGGKRPIDSQAKLLAMCEGPGRAEELAVARLTALPLIREALATRMEGRVANGQTRVADWHVAATALRVPAEFAEAIMSQPVVRQVQTSAAAALRLLTESTLQLTSNLTPRPRGYRVDGTSQVTRDEMSLTIDAGGAAVARWSTRLFRESHHLPVSGLAF